MGKLQNIGRSMESRHLHPARVPCLNEGGITVIRCSCPGWVVNANWAPLTFATARDNMGVVQKYEPGHNISYDTRVLLTHKHTTGYGRFRYAALEPASTWAT